MHRSCMLPTSVPIMWQAGETQPNRSTRSSPAEPVLTQKLVGMAQKPGWLFRFKAAERMHRASLAAKC